VKLPSVERAVIDQPKLQDYLLSPSHPVGRFKVRFFIALGYERDSWSVLHDDLLAAVRRAKATRGQPTPFGQKYEVRATLVGPAGVTAGVVSVWIVLTGEDFPRFVTAFPE
jgi:hypothetical protein